MERLGAVACFKDEVAILTADGVDEADLADVVQQAGGESDFRIGLLYVGEDGGGGGGGEGVVPEISAVGEIAVLAGFENGSGDDFGGDSVKFAEADAKNCFLNGVGAKAEAEGDAITNAQDISRKAGINTNDIRQCVGRVLIISQ